jgi:hypothetical protein
MAVVGWVAIAVVLVAVLVVLLFAVMSMPDLARDRRLRKM